MSFALPFALLLGALVAGPIIAHVVRRRETPTVHLPTFRLLERAAAESRKQRRLDDPYLFALRALFVLLAALAASAPFIEVPLEIGDGRACAMAVVVDSSRSMLARRGTTPILELARDRAARALEGLPPGSERTLVLASDPVTVLADRAASGEAAALAARSIDASRATAGDTLLTAIDAAVRRLHGSSLALRRLVVYSDFARHVDLRALDVPAGIDVELVRVSPESVGNAAVVLESVVSDEASPRARTVRASVRGFGITPSTRLALDVEGRTVAERATRAADPPEIVSLVAETGDHAPAARLSAPLEDSLPEDDRVDFVLRPPRETRVLFVDGEPGANRFDDEVGLAARALELVPEGERRFESTRVDAGGVDAAMLDRHDVVVLANVRSLPSSLADALVSRVQAGLGLLVAPSDRTDGRSLSQSLAPILPARLGLYARCDERRGATTRDAPTALVVVGVGDVVHRGCTEIDPLFGRSRTALVRSDGSPLLVLSQVGRGRVGVLGVALDPEGSDLPLRPGFIPLLASLVGYLDGSSSAAGDNVRIGTSIGLGDASLLVRAPSGEVLRPREDGSVGPLRELGPHVVLRGDVPDDDASFTVVIPPSESDLRPQALPPSRRARTNRADRGRLARDVSPPAFVLLGVLLVSEGIVRELQRGRRRASTTRSTPP